MPELDFRTLQTLPQRVKRLTQEHADRVAIRSIEHGAQTWREIFESSLRWAYALRDAGGSRGDVGATMLPQSLEPHHV
jgi:acyl-CoA synthetase (AMP-forming)/AMP-acid ligase II